MALHYQTEYRLGNRGRICRTYTGFQAFVAIALDLAFGLFFELVFATFGLAIRVAVLTARLVIRMLQLYWRAMVAAMTLAVYMVTLPFVWIHQAVDRFRSSAAEEPGARCRWGSESSRKPIWAFGREV